jgi:hemerythrin superfamily protein
VEISTSALSRIYRSADADEVLAGIWYEGQQPQGVLIELDGRRWVVYQHMQMSTGWVAALAGPDGAPIPGSELALPVLPGEQGGVPRTWWERFRYGTHPLPLPTWTAPLGQTVPPPRTAPDPPHRSRAVLTGRPSPPSNHRPGEIMSHPPVSVTLAAQHDQIAALMQAVQQTSGDERRGAFDEFSAYLAAHEAAEEEAIHPAARTGAGGVVAQRLAEEHDAGALITTLEHLGVDSAEFDATFARLHRAVLEHAHREERDEFPDLDTVKDTRTLIRMRYAVTLVNSLAARNLGSDRSFLDRVDSGR